MKTATFYPLLLLAMAFSVAVTGCKKTPKSPTPIYGKPAPAPGNAKPGDLENAGATLPTGPNTSVTPIPGGPGGPGSDAQSSLAPRETLDDYFVDREVFRQDTVYFGFDKYNVRPGELPKVKNVADYLKGQPTFKVLIEGNCDERGTPEYNRALGERRALAIRESLIQLGLSGDRVQTVSFGEDKPVDQGHDEAAWSKNRRGEFALLKPKSGGMASDNR
jgi:peptidoglycan-associated lipoprotein